MINAALILLIESQIKNDKELERGLDLCVALLELEKNPNQTILDTLKALRRHIGKLRCSIQSNEATLNRIL